MNTHISISSVFDISFISNSPDEYEGNQRVEFGKDVFTLSCTEAAGGHEIPTRSLFRIEELDDALLRELKT